MNPPIKHLAHKPVAPEAIRYPSLQRYISQSGHCSRRKAAELIEVGKVELDGEICRTPWQPVEPGQRVKVNGVGIQSHKPKHLLYLALHKPPGYLSTNSDPHGRPCAIHLIQPIYSERLFHVGRLDKNSSGLIFFTNDGDFAQSVQHPSHIIEKEYEVKTRKSIPEFVMQHWQRGIEIDDVRYKLRHYQMLGHREVMLVLTEGLNREIRRVFEYFHIPLKRVHRLRIGTVKLHGLAPGEFRMLKPYEIKALQSGKNPEIGGDNPQHRHAPNYQNYRSQQNQHGYHDHGERDHGKRNHGERNYQTHSTYAQKRSRTANGGPRQQQQHQRGLYNSPSRPYSRSHQGNGGPQTTPHSQNRPSNSQDTSNRNGLSHRNSYRNNQGNRQDNSGNHKSQDSRSNYRPTPQPSNSASNRSSNHSQYGRTKPSANQANARNQRRSNNSRGSRSRLDKRS